MRWPEYNEFKPGDIIDWKNSNGNHSGEIYDGIDGTLYVNPSEGAGFKLRLFLTSGYPNELTNWARPI